MYLLLKLLGSYTALMLLAGTAQAQATPPVVVREGIQIGALGALRSALPVVASERVLTSRIPAVAAVRVAP